MIIGKNHVPRQNGLPVLDLKMLTMAADTTVMSGCLSRGELKG